MDQERPDEGSAESRSPLPLFREIELTLAVAPDALARLRQDPLLKARSRGRAVTKALESVYFDTADNALSRARVSLRVRRIGDKFIQTLKGPTVPGEGLGRPEWEWPVAGPEPDLSAIDQGDALDMLGTVGAADLRPVFSTHIRRTIRHIVGEDAEIEVAFDVGELRTPGGDSAPVSEVELELKGGAAGALHALAIEIARRVPVRRETRSKAARGFALAQRRLGQPRKAGKLALDPAGTAEEALRHILESCLLHLTGNEACALDGTDPEGVHQMRVALRRMRSAFSLFRPLIPSESHDRLVNEIRWLAGSLGPARDWDVFLGDLLAPVQAALNGADAALSGDLAQLEEAARAQRGRAYDAARDAIGSRRASLFVLELGAWLDGRGWRRQEVSEVSARLLLPVHELADELLAKRHRKARKLGRGFADLGAEERHTLRIALKKLRYAAEFFAALHDDKAARRYTAHLAPFQDALGHLNDVATATRLMRALHDDGSSPAPGEARAAGVVIGWHARGLIDREDELRHLWKGFAEAKPFWSKPPRQE